MESYLPKSVAKKSPIRLGMVGGGDEAFIGAVHRTSARLDGHFDFVAGALSSTPEKAYKSAATLGLEPDRSYPDFHTMAKFESARNDGIEAVSIVTPNHLHADIAIAFLKQNIHVICDKPLTASLSQARRLANVARASSAHFYLTHNYSGYPMIRQARELLQAGELGAVRSVVVEYSSDWLSERQEESGLKQAVWRTDSAQSGFGGCIADIGTHAYHLAKFVTNLEVDELSADLSTLVVGRGVDDHAQVQLRYKGGARGLLWASQIALGQENTLRLRIFGEKGGLDWCQEDPNYLYFTKAGEAKRILTRMGKETTNGAMAVSRVPAGLPEGYLEAFANLYTEVAAQIYYSRGNDGKQINSLLPDLESGLEGMSFVDACLRSSKHNAGWKTLDPL